MSDFSIRGLLAAIAITLAAGAPLSVEERDSCDCYKNPAGLVFTEVDGIDFRSLSRYASNPAAIENWDGNVNAGSTSSYFSSSTWTSMFGARSWARPASTVPMVYSKNNVYIATDSTNSQYTYLTLRTHRSSTFQSSAEIDSTSADYTAASWHVVGRARGDAGACMGMFTYKYGNDAAETEYEQDMEILTYESGATTVHYSTHPENDSTNSTMAKAASTAATLPSSGKWTDFHEYRMDWTAPSTQFYVDGTLNGKMNHVYKQPASQLILNAWSKGGPWEHAMAVGGNAYFDIRYITMAYNTSASVGYKCKSTCNV